MKYQHIEFIDGSNPYISKTEKNFKWMCKHYVLIPIAENFWKATDRIYYKVVGFVDKDKGFIFATDIVKGFEDVLKLLNMDHFNTWIYSAKFKII